MFVDKGLFIEFTIPDAGWFTEPIEGALDVPAPQWLYGLTTLAHRERSPLHMHPSEYRRFLAAPFQHVRGVRIVGKRVDTTMGCAIVVSPTIPPGTIRITKGSLA
jgi:hypothetical protein